MAGTRTLIAMVVAVFGYALMQTVVVPALTLLQNRLHATPTTSAWILSAFLLSSAVLTPLLGRLGDQYGRRRVVLAVLVVASGRVSNSTFTTLFLLAALAAVIGIGIAFLAVRPASAATSAAPAVAR